MNLSAATHRNCHWLRGQRLKSQDNRDGKVSRRAAKEQYGVALKPDGGVDEDATRALRAASEKNPGKEFLIDRGKAGLGLEVV